MLSLVFFTALLGAPTDDPEDAKKPRVEEGPRIVMPGTKEDLSKFDKSPEQLRSEEEAKEEARLSAWLEVSSEPAPTLAIGRGDARFVRVDVPIKRRPNGPIFWRVLSEAQDGAVVSPWIESLSFVEEKKRLFARGRYALLVEPNAKPRASFAGKIEIREKDTWSVIGEARIVATVEVKPAEYNAAEVEDLRRAYGIFSTKARNALDRLPELSAYLRVDGMDGPPASTSSESLPKVEAFLAARVRAAIAERRLRAAADGTDPTVAEQAVLALGSLRKSTEGSNAGAAADRRSNAENLAIARKLVDALSFEEAELLLTRLRTRGQMIQSELEEVLLLLGAVYSAKGLDDRAKKAFGQALCLNPAAKSPSSRPPMSRAFEAVRVTEPCPEGVKPKEPRAVLVSDPRGTHLDVSIAFGPDPHELVSGGEIDIFGPGGDVMLKASSRAEGSVLSARFELTESIANDIRSRVLARIVAKEISGISVFSLGTEQPLSIDVERAEKPSTVSTMPWWIWVAGGAGIIGISAIVVAAASGSDSGSRAIGPVGVTF
ncbi:MAG: hypothetical protein HY791_20080 [Deltaproteobacteria bacterium]|nr:hypothetical protein [Deltaproteobacteria bacterium]